MAKKYYLDTCIWLNLFKREVDIKNNILIWELAKDLLEQIERSGDLIIVSTITLKELSFTSGEKFPLIKQFFGDSDFIKIIKTTPEDYTLARQFEQLHHSLSFYDYLHLAIAQRLGLLFVTRDNKLIEFSQKHVNVFRPEDLIY